MPRIHITGAAGTGTTTLGNALPLHHFDSDDYLWEPTDPPYRKLRPSPERRRLLMRDLCGRDHWVVSGSFVSWGAPAVPLLTLTVFLTLPTELRLERLRARELLLLARHPGWPREDFDREQEKFLAWAALYDDGGMEVRSRMAHEAWLRSLPCPVLRLEGDTTTTERVRRVLAVA